MFDHLSRGERQWKMKLETRKGLEIMLDGAEKMRVTIRNNSNLKWGQI